MQVLGQIGAQIESALTPIAGTRGVFAERTGDGFLLDIQWNRDELARKSEERFLTQRSDHVMYSLRPLAVLDKPSASAIISPGVMGGLVESCRSSLDAMKAKGR